MNSAHNERQLLEAKKGRKIRLLRGGPVTMAIDQLFPVTSLPRDLPYRQTDTHTHRELKPMSWPYPWRTAGGTVMKNGQKHKLEG